MTRRAPTAAECAETIRRDLAAGYPRHPDRREMGERFLVAFERLQEREQ